MTYLIRFVVAFAILAACICTLRFLWTSCVPRHTGPSMREEIVAATRILKTTIEANGCKCVPVKACECKPADAATNLRADDFRPCKPHELPNGPNGPPPCPLSKNPGDPDPRVGNAFRWEINDRGELLYRNLGKSSIRIEVAK